MKVITFVIGTRWCVMPVHHLVEILPARELLPLPQLASTELNRGAEPGLVTVGIVDYRGKAIPVMRLHLEPRVGDAAAPAAPGAPPIKQRLLVLGGNPPGALEVGRVDAVIELDAEAIQPPGDIGLRDHGMVSGVCRLHNAYAFVIDGTAVSAGRGVESLSTTSPGISPGASNG